MRGLVSLTARLGRMAKADRIRVDTAASTVIQAAGRGVVVGSTRFHVQRLRRMPAVSVLSADIPAGAASLLPAALSTLFAASALCMEEEHGHEQGHEQHGGQPAAPSIPQLAAIPPVAAAYAAAVVPGSAAATPATAAAVVAAAVASTASIVNTSAGGGGTDGRDPKRRRIARVAAATFEGDRSDDSPLTVDIGNALLAFHADLEMNALVDELHKGRTFLALGAGGEGQQRIKLIFSANYPVIRTKAHGWDVKMLRGCE